jgi:copper chaperone
MTIKLNVPSIACEVCAQTITKAIKNQYPEAQVSVDVANQIVTVAAEASETEIKETITAAGHSVAPK